MMHGIHDILPPSETDQYRGGNSAPENNLDKGDGIWEYNMEILRWIFNGQDYTLRLPDDKIKKILERLHNIIKFTTKTPRTTQVKKFNPGRGNHF